MKYSTTFNDLDPKMDWVFKMLFSNSKENYKILVSFLNAILAEKYGEIKTVQLLNTDFTKDKPKASSYYLDFVIKTDNDLFINLEMQNSQKEYFMNRSQFYVMEMIKRFISFTHYEDLKKQDRNEDFAISISVCSFKLNKKNKKQIIPKNYFMEFIYLEILEILSYTKNRKVKELSKKERWCKFLAYQKTDKDDGTIAKICEIEEGIKMAQEAIVKVTQAERQAAMELSEWKYQFTMNCERAEARREGLAAGIEQGEYKKAIETAKIMKESNYPLNEIARVCNLSRKEIENI